MVRSLWSAASGMKGQQTSVDTIANNLANVNTTGYKAQNAQFKTLLYQTLQSKSTNAQGDTKPTAAQVGLGTRVASLNSNFTQGAQLANDSNTAMCIIGEGFFAVQDGTETHYTRNGNFSWAINDAGEKVLTTPEGYQVLDQANQPIKVPKTVEKDFKVDPDTGAITIQNADGKYTATGQSVAIYQFTNRVGLNKIGENLYDESEASGEPMPEWSTQGVIRSEVVQNYLEGSNVNVADEMVNLIIAQRAYEMNSKAITTSDTMLEQANNLKR
ncbi:flagellar basal-body rod protein FlgG [Pseudobutyrivibrio sp. ACV-2]|uniref:flagellar hook-basal body protein n=1 Tax=Pseudobutyrivibrio sp. ACV-2 TaxID=1520801 RepID=UPI00089919E6|nr:flagellar hook-basal body protein [Pseudobutyrivibrio sp. ACV-2]SEA08897.1 flagellar basal-body rod protein FlgG [Pseudobutyrivibrio sp. ACV-2]